MSVLGFMNKVLWSSQTEAILVNSNQKSRPLVNAMACGGRQERSISSKSYIRHWEEAQAGIKIARKNINNLRYADDTILMVESDEELKSLLMKVKEE